MQIKDGLEIERRFLLAALPDISGMADAPSRIEQVYLKKEGAGPEETHRLRKATDPSGNTVYYYTVKSPGKDGARNERESEIELAEYAELMKSRDPERRMIAKTRHAIPFAGHTLELDVFEAELAGLIVLEIELTSFDAPLELPDWAKTGAEITHDFWFSNSNLSLVDLGEIRRRVAEKLNP